MGISLRDWGLREQQANGLEQIPVRESLAWTGAVNMRKCIQESKGSRKQMSSMTIRKLGETSGETSSSSWLHGQSQPVATNIPTTWGCSWLFHYGFPFLGREGPCILTLASDFITYLMCWLWFLFSLFPDALTSWGLIDTRRTAPSK